MIPHQFGMLASIETNVRDRWGSQSSSSVEASASNSRLTLKAIEIQNWLRMGTRNGDPNPEVFVGPRSWNQIEGFAGPKDYPSIGQTSCGPVSIINPQARIEESEVSPYVNCLSIR
ncbi:unnamed protein product [Prunus armeniaca]